MDIKQKFWKRFEDWDTGSEHKVLHQTRLKLAFYYVLLLACILFIYGSFLCFSLKKNINGSFVGGNEATKAAVSMQAVDALERSIISADFTVLVLGGVFGYILGKNILNPVKKSFLLERRFSADASHELRTPLAIMKTDIEVLLRKKKNNSKDLRLLAVRNLEEVDRMSRMVEDLLLLSREERTGKLGCGKVNLGNIAGKIVKKMEALARDKNITVSIRRMDEGLVIGSPIAIERAIFNIFQNAINYTPSGGNISVDVRRSREYMVLSVKDTGIGISKKDLPRIFERFYKADLSRSVRPEGAGLGLSIVRGIVEKHGGKIKISSRPGKGTKVAVRFPMVVD